MQEPVALYLMAFGGLLLAAVLLDDLADRVKLPGILLVLALGLLVDNDMRAAGEPLLSLPRANNITQAALVLVLFFGGLTTNWSRMKAVVKPIILFGVAAGVSLTGWWVVGPGDPDGRVASMLAPAAHSYFGGGYKLEDLALAGSTLDEIERSYVDPARVNHEVMYEAALDAIQRKVPTVLFRRVPGSALVHVQVGEHRAGGYVAFNVVNCDGGTYLLPVLVGLAAPACSRGERVEG